MTCFHVWCGFDNRYCDQCRPKLREVMSSGEPRAWDSDDERRGWYAGYDAAVAEAAGLSRTLPAPGEVEARFWLIVHKPGNVPERKGSWPITEQTRVLREFMKARPDSYLHIVTVDREGVPEVQHGPEALQMADQRSLGTGRKHNARTLAAHAEAACTCGSPYYDLGAHLSTCPTAKAESLATVAAANDEGVAEALIAEWHTEKAEWRGNNDLIDRTIRLLSQGGGRKLFCEMPDDQVVAIARCDIKRGQQVTAVMLGDPGATSRSQHEGASS